MRNIWRTIRWRNNAQLPGAIEVLTNQHIGDSYCVNPKLDTVLFVKTIITYLPRAHNFWKEIFFLMKWPVSISPKQETKAKQIFQVIILQICVPYRFHQIHGLLENTITKFNAVNFTYIQQRRCKIKILKRDQRRGHALTPYITGCDKRPAISNLCIFDQ